jgi:hypothetical protein
MAGGKTGIVIRSEKIYAFCPNSPDATGEEYMSQKPSFSLLQNSPNPCNQHTTINYELYKPAMVELSVYDVYGNSLRTLVEANQNTGQYSIVFNAGNLASGLYYFRLTSNNQSQVKKMIVLR